MTCDECQILREHYPRDPEVRLARARLFSPACLHCGARLIQTHQRRYGVTRDEKVAACRKALSMWMQYGHSEDELRRLATSGDWAISKEQK